MISGYNFPKYQKNKEEYFSKLKEKYKEERYEFSPKIDSKYNYFNVTLALGELSKLKVISSKTKLEIDTCNCLRGQR